MADNNDIFFEGTEITEELLLKYVQGNASEEESSAIKKILDESEFMQDAVEGLKSFSSDKNLREYVQQLNKHLHQQLHNRKQRDKKSHIKHLYWSILTVLIILLLCFIAYFIILQRKKEERAKMQQPVTMIRQWKN